MQEAFQKWSLSGEFLDGGLDLGIRIQRQQVLSTFIQAWWTPACYCHPHFVLFCFLDEELHSLTYICVLSHHQNDLACQSDGASSRLKTPPMVPADSPDSALSSQLLPLPHWDLSYPGVFVPVDSLHTLLFHWPTPLAFQISIQRVTSPGGLLPSPSQCRHPGLTLLLLLYCINSPLDSTFPQE